MKLFVFVYFAIQIIAIKCKVLHIRMLVLIWYSILLVFISNDDDLLQNVCHRSNSDVKSCVAKQLEKSVHYLITNGYPQYNVPKMDPFDIISLTFERPIADLASIKGTIKNMRVIGLSNFALTDTTYHDDGQNIVGEVEFYHPNNYVTLDMNIAINLTETPINIEGFLKANLTDVTTRLKISLKTIVKGGVKYFTLNNFKVKTSVGGSHLAVESKNPQNQALIDFAVNSFNVDQKQFIDFLHPFYAETAENLVGAEIEKVLSAVPAETLLPQ